MIKDPVCGMVLDESRATLVAEHRGATYRFCSRACRDRFVEDPERFVDPPPKSGMGAAGVALVLLLVTSPGLADGSPRTLDLEESLRIALAGNPGLEAVRHRLAGADADVREADAKGRPHVDTRAGYLRFEDPPTISLLGQSAQLGRPDAFFADLEVRQLIASGGAVRAGGSAARANRAATGATYESARRDLALEVHRVYYRALLARELVEVRRASLDQLASHLEVTRDRFEQGAATEYEVLRAQVELANHRPLLVEAQNRRADAIDSLVRLLGLEPGTEVELQGDLPALSAAAVEQAPDDGQRPELAAARAREEGSEAVLEIARAARRPSVSWFAQVFATSPEYFIAADSDPAINGLAGIVVSLPVLDGGERSARIARADAELSEARARRRDVEAGIALEVSLARRRLHEAEAVLDAQGPVIEQGTRALEIARVRFEHGLGTQLEVTDAQLALTEARLERLRALAERAVAAAELRHATGESLFPGGSDDS